MEHLHSTSVSHWLKAGGGVGGQEEKDINSQALLGLECRQSRFWQPRAPDNKDTRCWLRSDSSSGTYIHKNGK